MDVDEQIAKSWSALGIGIVDMLVGYHVFSVVEEFR
jgi:hypothetical protein